MEKSFYYIVPKRDVRIYSSQLSAHEIPYIVESHPGIHPSNLAIIFPDLPVRQYGVVHKIFQRVGIPYSVP